MSATKLGEVKWFILFSVWIITGMLWRAMDRTIAITYFASPQGDASLFWWGSLLLLLVCSIGLYSIKKAEPMGKTGTSSSGKASGWLLLASLFCCVAAVFDIQTVIERVSAPQLPMVMKFWFLALTTINLGAFAWWTLGNYRNWKSLGRRDLRLKE